MEKNEILLALITAVIISGLVVFGILSPYFEAKAFNKFSNTKATYWDALFTDLRVIPDQKK